MRRAWPWKNSQARVPWLVLFAVAAAGVWLLAQHFRAAVVVRVIASAVTLALPVIADQLIKSVFQRDDDLTKASLAHLRGYSRRRGIPVVQSVRDITMLGVTQIRDGTGSEMSPYLTRDKDRNLDELLASNTFVLLIGDSKAGKSRMAAEAMRRNYPDRNLIIPREADSLGALLDAGLDFAGSVVWLDELQRYLEQSGLSRLLDLLTGPDAPRDVTVLATIREKAYTPYMPDGEIESPYWAVLKRSARLRIDRMLSDTERQRASAMFQDPHILAALDRFGLAEYLSAGPDLMDKLESGYTEQPIGTMLVLAAADWSRTGVTRPVPEAVLVVLVENYRQRFQVKQPGPTDFDAALAWAQKPMYGASQLLSQGQDGFTVFDYVLDHAPKDAAIPSEVWDAAISAAQGEELVHVGLAAYEQNQLEVAGRVFELVIRQDTPLIDRTLTAYNYARILEKQGRAAEALEYYRRAADAGHVDAGCAAGRILQAQGDTDGARQYYQAAADAGNPDAAYALGLLLREADPAQALPWFTQAAEAGHAEAGYAAGRILESRGDTGGARQYYQAAADAGNLDAAYALGMLLREADPAQALPWFTKAARAGHRQAAYAAGRILQDRGDDDEARRYYALATEEEPGHRQLVAARPRLTVAGAERGLRELYQVADRAVSFEDQFAAYSDGELRERTASLRRRTGHGATVDELVPEAFAVLREAATRALGLQCLDVQLVGAAALHRGRIARMHRGEGHGAAAMLAAYANTLAGDPVHILAPDEAAAQQEAQRLEKVYGFLGTPTSAVIGGMTPAARRVAYQSAVVCVSAEEASFDYLRDCLAWTEYEQVLRGLSYAIVHEADSLMIDDAQESYSISGPGDSPTRWYTEMAKIARRLRSGTDYDVDTAVRRVPLTEQGIQRVEDWLGIDNLYDTVNLALLSYMEAALEAKELYARDRDYVVVNGRVLLCDENGRVNPGRRAGRGVDRALEAKEGCQIQDEQNTMGTIYRWAFLKLYQRLSGLTSTSADIADAFQRIYRTEVCEIPTDRPRRLSQRSDLVFYNETGRWPALAELVEGKHAAGQPVLVDVISDEQGRTASRALAARGIPHRLLGLSRATEEDVLADAARKGAVTVGAGLHQYSGDIRLGGAAGTQQDREDVAALGGLAVIGLERHAERRTDDRLCELAAHGGDPGECVFMVSRRGGGLGDIIKFPGFDWVGDEPVTNALVDRAVRSLQRTMALVHDEERTENLRYSQVIERQRAEIAALREQALEGTTIDELATEWRRKAVDSVLAAHLDGHRNVEDMDALNRGLRHLLGPSIAPLELGPGTGDGTRPGHRPDAARLAADAHAIAQRAWDARAAELTMDLWVEIERRVLLSVADRCWREQLVELNELWSATGLSTLTSRAPFTEYLKKAEDSFQAMRSRIVDEFVGNCMNLQFEVQENPIIEEDTAS